MAKVIVVGGGGREHALTTFLERSPDVEAVYTAPGNAGTPGRSGVSGSGPSLSGGAGGGGGVGGGPS